MNTYEGNGGKYVNKTSSSIGKQTDLFGKPTPIQKAIDDSNKKSNKPQKGAMRYAGNGKMERWDGNSWELVASKKAKASSGKPSKDEVNVSAVLYNEEIAGRANTLIKKINALDSNNDRVVSRKNWGAYVAYKNELKSLLGKVKDVDGDGKKSDSSLYAKIQKQVNIKRNVAKPAASTAENNNNSQPAQKVDKKDKDTKKAKDKAGSVDSGSGNSAGTPGTINKGQQGDAKKAADSNGFLTRYGDPETAQKALYATIDAIAKADPGAVREFGTRGTAGYYAELKTKDGWVSANSNKAVSQLTKYAPSKEEAAALPALVFAPNSTNTVRISPVGAPNLISTQLAEKAHFTAAKPLSSTDFDLSEAAKKSRAILAAADMNSDGKLAKSEAALYNPADRNGNGKIGTKEATKFIAVADTNKSGVISAEESSAFAILDTNDNGKLGKKEFIAYKEIDANGDGDITGEEAQAAYSAKVATTQDKRTRQLAKEFLDKNSAKTGAQAAEAQVAALAGVPVATTAQNPQAATPATPAVPAAVGAPATPAVPAVSAKPANPASAPQIKFAADRNDNGKVGAGELAKFESIADADASGEVTAAEAQAFALIDSNENGKIGKKELEAFRRIDANHDGNLTAKEAKAALKAQIDSVQDKRTHDLAKDYLAKNPGNGGGSDEVDAAAAALVNAGRTESSLKKEAAAAKKLKK